MRTNRFNITFEDAYHALTVRKNALEELSDVRFCKIMWECQWNQMKLLDPEVKAFVQTFDKISIPPPMALRESFRGGICLPYLLWANAEEIAERYKTINDLPEVDVTKFTGSLLDYNSM